MIRQTLVVLKKNILMMQKTKVVRQSIYIPLVCACLAVLSKQDIPFVDFLQYLWPVYQCVAVNGVVRQTVMELVRARNEKEQENELIMGLRSSSYFLGNWIGCVVLTFLAGALYIFPAIIGGVYSGINPFEVLGAYALFLLALVNQMYCLSSLFQSPLLVGDLCSLINLIVSLMFSSVSFLTASTSKVFLLVITFFPQASLQFLFYSKNWLARIDRIKDEEGAPTDFTYLSTLSILSLVGEMFGYFIIYLYCNAVWPNEYGTQKKPWFFVMPLINLFRKSPKIETNNNSQNYTNKNILESYGNDDDDEEEKDKGVMLDTSSAVYHQPMNIAGMKQEIQICNLNKAFAGYLAVNNLSLNIYAGQIFCLLGHNGAGKTTTLNLLCGMQSKTSGQIIIHGRDLDTSIDAIRQSIGLCNQQNLLYSMLSVEEHLSYYCDIKGVTGEEKFNDIENIIEKCRLQGERTKCASNLSGGNKRKLSLAIALVGKAKTVFLDEPTTGVDSLTREQIWSTLRSIRDEGRVVVLSTHNLDEAECLADRVAIMAQGRLLALGTVSYITKQFSTGYQLSIKEKDAETEEQQMSNFEELAAILKKYFPDCKIFNNNHKNHKATVQSQGFRALLPFTETALYAQLFTALEARKGIRIDLQMNSLEDAFININLETDKYLHSVVNKDYSQSFVSGSEDHQLKQEQIQPSQLQKHRQQDDHSSSSFLVQQQPPVPQSFQTSFQHAQQDFSQSSLSHQNQMKVPFLNGHQLLSEFIYQDLPSNNTIFQSNSSENTTTTTHLLQISAIIIRRAKYIYRSWVNVIALIIPFLFLILSYLVIFSDPAKYGYESVIIIIQFTLSFQSFNYMCVVIYEKHATIKNSLRISGCTMKNYWLATIISEMLLSLIFIAIFQVMFTCMGSEYNVQSSFDVSPGEFLLQTSILTLTNLAQALLFSGFFNNPHEASLGLPCLQMIMTEYVGYMLVGMQNSSIAFFQVISFIPFLVNPASVMGYVLITFPDLKEDERANLWFGTNVRSYYIFVTFVSLVFIGLTVYLEYNSINDMFQKKGVQSLRCTDAQSKRIDNDVYKEDQEVGLEQNKLKYPIKAHRLKKVFPNNYIAINKISFGVEKKQIFGLLGPNGAGKSTTFNILTSSDRDYRGQAQVNQEKVKQKNEKIWANADCLAIFGTSKGVCPQSDVLWENLTVMDHFQIHSTLKGLSGQRKQAMIDYFLTTMQLSEHQHKKTKFLSGGNKRKLSVCLSILGGPRILFLDEPTSGIDPITKRFLWHALQQTVEMNDSSIVLTTHSMQEAQFLCNKIGILINGQFACMGSSDHLARKYGNGYRLSLKMVVSADDSKSSLHLASQNGNSLKNSENFKNIISNKNNSNNSMSLGISKTSQISTRIAHIDQKVLSSLPDTQKLTSRNSEYLTYQITEHTFRFSVVFSLIDQLMRDQLIQDYTLHHANLEQIFQFFAGFQSQFIEPPLQEDRNELCDCQQLNSCRWCCLICCGCVW